MPNKKISQLDLASALDGSELVEIVQGGANVQTTTQDIADLGGGGGGSSNDKADALITVDDSHGGNYTLAAAELTAINTGVTLILEGDTSGDLTVPTNATVAFPVGTVIGLRDYNNVVEEVGVSVTPTSGTLEITDGMTASLEKTGTNTWILHNGSSASGGGGGGGHEIKTSGTPLTQRAGLNFSSKFAVTDDSGNDETDVDFIYSETLCVAFGDEVTPVTATTNKLIFHWPYSNTTVTGMWVGLSTVQTSGSVFTVDVNKNGTTMLNTKITVDNTEETSRTAATAPVLSVTSLTVGDKISVDVDQLGDNTAKGPKLYIEYTRT